MLNVETNPTPSPELRAYILNRDDGICQYCGRTDNLIIEHVIPFLQGGHTAAYNLVAACVSCNCHKRTYTWVPRNINLLIQESALWAARIQLEAAKAPTEERLITSYKIRPSVAKRIKAYARKVADRPISHVAEDAFLEYLERHGG